MKNSNQRYLTRKQHLIKRLTLGWSKTVKGTGFQAEGSAFNYETIRCIIPTPANPYCATNHIMFYHLGFSLEKIREWELPIVERQKDNLNNGRERVLWGAIVMSLKRLTTRSARSGEEEMSKRLHKRMNTKTPQNLGTGKKEDNAARKEIFSLISQRQSRFEWWPIA